MKPLRLNADYETELFTGKQGSSLISQTLEFFIFFLTDRTLYTHKNYSADYLAYVEKITGRAPQISNKTPYENWWGLLQNTEKEKWWNSKMTSAELVLQKKWCDKTFIVHAENEIPEFSGQEILIKDPFGMSGQKFQTTKDKPQIKNFPLIIEPLLNRKFDFSQYVFPDGQIIAYENQVDEKFQYKGTSFTTGVCRLEDLSFFELISEEEWDLYRQRTKEIIEYYSRFPNEIGYSIDSFVFEENGTLKIRPLSEINYRRTMGRVAYELATRYFPDFSRCTLQLLKPVPGEPLWKKYQDDQNFLVLSPGDTRFEVLLLSDA